MAQEEVHEGISTTSKSHTSNGASKTGAVAGVSNLIFSGGACGIILGVGTLLSPGCLIYLAYTSIGVGAIGGIVTNAYERIPGSSMRSKMAIVLPISFVLFFSGIYLPLTPSLTEPVSAEFNLVYFAAAALVTTSVIAYMYSRLNGKGAKDILCKYC